MSEMKTVICQFCDMSCPLLAEVDGSTIIKLHAMPQNPAICVKAHQWKQYINHSKRLLHPLKNVGKRGEQEWQRISWKQAMDEIAEKLQKVINKYGPESFALSTLPTNAQVHNGVTRRFMNLVGSPNWITGLSMCVGNTAQIHRLTYGWYISSSYETANCIVYHGHNPGPNNWVAEYMRLNNAINRGAKLIVIDPRRSEAAERADIHLPIRYGTDAALLLGWLNIIINEELYDKEFVENWTVGFEKLKERVQEYPLSRVAEITGCEPEMIRQAAIMYANTKPAIMPWGVVPDMQKNSTSVLRCQCILRAICGNLNKGEMLGYLSPDVVSISEIELHEALPEEKKKLQLGTETYPLFTYTGSKKLNQAAKRVYGKEYINLASGSFMAHPPTVFKAMRTGIPYPVKAFFSLGSNPLMGYANQQGILEGLMNQELVVVYDHFLTPTAQLADYVLPGDAWLERPYLGPVFDAGPVSIASHQITNPPAECKDEYYFISELAKRMGLAEYFPWKDLKDLLNYRIKETGMNWEDFEKTLVHLPSKGFDPFSSGTGLATPSGKVELYSSVLEELGYDPLPYFREPAQSPISNPELAVNYPLTLFAGLREGPYYNTNLRQIPELRETLPDPLSLLNPEDGKKYGIISGEWIWVETTHGKVKMMAQLDDVQPPGTIRVPHGWWMSEMEPGLETGLSGAMLYNDGMLLSDDDWNLDPEQGLPNLRGGILARVYKVAKES